MFLVLSFLFLVLCWVVKMKITKFEDVEAWQLGRELTRKIYAITKKGNLQQ